MGYTPPDVNVKSGYLVLGRFRGAPIRLHWTVPLGIVVFTGLRFAPGAWLGFVLLILVHELGHAIAVASARLEVSAVDVLGFGGLCRWDGYPTPRQRVLIAWGGILAQAVLGLATLAALFAFGRPASPFTADLVEAFTRTNVWLIMVNLLPVPPLDGVEAWGVIGLFNASRARKRNEIAQAAERTRAAEERARARAALPPGLHHLDELEPQDLPPMPDEVKRVLDRILAEGRAEHESAKKK